MMKEFDKYIIQVTKELDEIGFGALVSIVHPLEDEMATFMAMLAIKHFKRGLDYRICAERITVIFLKALSECDKKGMN